MRVYIEDEALWRENERGRHMDVLRAYLEDRHDYFMDIANVLILRGELSPIETPAVYVEYGEPDPEFIGITETHLMGTVISKDKIEDIISRTGKDLSPAFIEITNGRMPDFIIRASFRTREDCAHNESGRYCPIWFSMMTCGDSPIPPDRLGLLIEPL